MASEVNIKNLGPLTLMSVRSRPDNFDVSKFIEGYSKEGLVLGPQVMCVSGYDNKHTTVSPPAGFSMETLGDTSFLFNDKFLEVVMPVQSPDNSWSGVVFCSPNGNISIAVVFVKLNGASINDLVMHMICVAAGVEKQIGSKIPTGFLVTTDRDAKGLENNGLLRDSGVKIFMPSKSTMFNRDPNITAIGDFMAFTNASKSVHTFNIAVRGTPREQNSHVPIIGRIFNWWQ